MVFELGLRRETRAFLCAAVLPLPTEKAVAVNPRGIFVGDVKDKNK